MQSVAILDAHVTIRRVREHARITQQELAALVGTSQSAISMYERGQRMPDLTTLDRIVRACGLTARVAFAPREVSNQLASYHDVLAHADDRFRLRVILHDFGLVWNSTAHSQRHALVVDEPPPLSARWDAFLAAYVEYLCWHDRIEPPRWVFDGGRYLDEVWMPGADLAVHRVEALVHSPAPFEARGVLISSSELVVV